MWQPGCFQQQNHRVYAKPTPPHFHMKYFPSLRRAPRSSISLGIQLARQKRHAGGVALANSPRERSRIFVAKFIRGATLRLANIRWCWRVRGVFASATSSSVVATVYAVNARTLAPRTARPNINNTRAQPLFQFSAHASRVRLSRER